MAIFLFFFFQAEDGIRDSSVTGVQTCALPISQRAELRNVHVTFYDQTGRPTSTLTSREGTHHWRTGDMEARGNVIVIRDTDGATMKTELMYYNQVRNEVSSDQSFVWDEPGRHVEGDGFTSDPEFKKITAKRPHGTGGQFLLPNQ